jgi:hypothetical protein
MVMEEWGVTAVFRLASFSIMFAMLLILIAKQRGTLSLP